MRVIRGKPIILQCNAMGIPFPNVTWYRDATPIEEDDRTHLLLSGRQLEIYDTTENDAASYVCVAVNAAGRLRHDIAVDILGTLY